MKEEWEKRKYPSRRHSLFALHGMVTTGNVLASNAGCDMLKKGGNAVDAAIATAAMLTVVEPTANGLGSDCFAIVWMNNKIYGLNASGRSPEKMSIESIQKKHGKIETMPKYGWTPVTVPGAVSGWVALHQRFGRLPFAELLKPAIEAALHGYPIQIETARMWKQAIKKARESWKAPEFAAWFSVFDQEIEPGKLIKLPSIAHALEQIAYTYGESFYRGEQAERLEEEAKKYGGFLRRSDLAQHQALWVDPIYVDYRGYQIWELPPNGQGIVALMALNALSNFQLEKRDAAHLHLQIEAIKQAFANAKAYVTDPIQMNIPISEMLSKTFGKLCADQIDQNQAFHYKAYPFQSGTVYLCTADQEGNMVSMIQSNYMGFGSGIVVDGISLQNRGADFSLDSTHVNQAAGMKRTYHTIIPGFLTKNHQAVGPFGIMGGYMQPQGHVQFISNLLDFSLDPQQALDAPRWQWIKNKQIEVEPEIDSSIIEGLRNKGHIVHIQKEYAHFGRGQCIFRLKNGVLVGACESRTDSNISCF